jgi:hypothetical protein
MSGLLFHPWIGPDYGNSNFGRLLIIGESHYFLLDEPDYLGYTARVVSSLGGPGDNNFFIKVGQVFHPEDHIDIWPKIAFANAIQFPYKEIRATPTKTQLETIEPAIQEYLNLTRPDKMIVFSYTVWNTGLPGTIKWGKQVDFLHDRKFDRKGTVWKFNYSSGVCYGLGVHHPSSINPPFKPEEWRPLIDQFLEKDFTL